MSNDQPWFGRMNRCAGLLVLASSMGALVSCNTFDETVALLLGPPEPVVIQATSVEASDAAAPPAHAAAPETSPAKVTDRKTKASDLENAASAAAAMTSSGPELPADDVIRRAKEHLASMVRRGIMTSLYTEDGGQTAQHVGNRYFVQIGSHQIQAAADTQIGIAKARFTGLISSLELRVRSIDLSQTRFFRVQIGPITSQSAARDLCQSLKGQNQECFTLVEVTPKGEAPEKIAQLHGGWASIGPNEMSSAKSPAPSVVIAQRARAAQVADASPLFTTPGLPGILE